MFSGGVYSNSSCTASSFTGFDIAYLVICKIRFEALWQDINMGRRELMKIMLYTAKDLANLSKADLRDLEVQAVMFTTSAGTFLSVAALAIFSRPLSSVNVFLVICLVVLVSCMLYRRRLLVTPDRYDVKSKLSQQEEETVKEAAAEMRVHLGWYMIAAVMATFILHLVCGLVYLALKVGFYELSAMSQYAGNIKMTVFGIAIILGMRLFFLGAMTYNQREIRVFYK